MSLPGVESGVLKNNTSYSNTIKNRESEKPRNVYMYLIHLFDDAEGGIMNLAHANRESRRHHPTGTRSLFLNESVFPSLTKTIS